jgi:hypothetical protein
VGVDRRRWLPREGFLQVAVALSIPGQFWQSDPRDDDPRFVN